MEYDECDQPKEESNRFSFKILFFTIVFSGKTEPVVAAAQESGAQ
jgi:hypothetical protein